MTATPKVSVVIPFLNAETHIERCVRSLCEQTLPEMEFIFVDDGSVDGSVSIIKKIFAEYPQRADSYTIHHHPVNLGLPAARKSGNALANGEYVIHCDSDDYVERDMYGRMYDKAVQGQHDVVICGVEKSDDNVCLERSVTKESKDYVDDLVSGRIRAYVWNKLVKREIYRSNLIYPSCNMWEDYPLSLQILIKGRSVGVIEDILYHYYSNPAGIVNSYEIEKRSREMAANLQLAENIIRKSFTPKESKRYIKHMTALKFVVKTHYFHESPQKYRSIYPEINLLLFLSRDITFLEKLGHVTAMLGIHGLLGRITGKY